MREVVGGGRCHSVGGAVGHGIAETEKQMEWKAIPRPIAGSILLLRQPQIDDGDDDDDDRTARLRPAQFVQSRSKSLKILRNRSKSSKIV